MILYSTNNKNLRVPFKDGVFNSLPSDKGLYMPVKVPVLDPEFLAELHKFTLPEIAFNVSKAILNDVIPDSDLKAIIDDAINFDAPVLEISKQINVLELFHGPSLAFKDFGARFMSRVMSYFLREGEKQLDVLVATSGDTGGAVALGFLRVSNVRVTILFPKGKVSPIQELQLTSIGYNIRAIEIDGTFDDCQALVKHAFNDSVLKERFRLTSANSINISRLIPQTFYYFYAYAQIQRMGFKEVVFSVPSGNFGNIGAGLLAWKMGLPIKQFLAATNINDTVPDFLRTGVYQARPSVQTWSNAMDVGDPSNWVRIMDLFGGNLEQLKKVITAYSYNDQETLGAIRKVFLENNYIMCPHTAIAWLALKRWMNEHNSNEIAGVFLATAHPCKFPDIFPEDTAREIVVPVQVKDLEGKEKVFVSLGKDYEEFKAYLLG
ncbi:MAG: threonine synthase [Bacteroidetes bacterium]|nr:threonine synthase [Bacteroidota bacterium]